MASNDPTTRHLMQQRANVVFVGVRLRGLWTHNKGARSALLAPQNPAPVLPGPPQVLRQEAFQVQLLAELCRECDDVARADLLPSVCTRVLIGVFQKFCDISAAPPLALLLINSTYFTLLCIITTSARQHTYLSFHQSREI